VAEERKAFSETRIYPIVFMILVALVFGSILALFYHSTAERISEHQQFRLQQAILSVFNLPLDEVPETYDRYIEERTATGVSYYQAREDTISLGYCFPVEGSGLWGTISGLLAVNNEFDRILAFYILDQNETPGLGGRITEPEFLDQFSDKEFRQNSEIVRFRMVPENEPTDRFEINQITGATSSSRAVVSIIHDKLQNIRSILELDYEEE
jgi:Na+-transporting NADH:ubiquinone oxidoreductase subunit C